jgi:hypothetical protein
MGFFKRGAGDRGEAEARRKRTASDDLLARIRERLAADTAGSAAPGSLPFAPATIAAIEEAERSLDFALPALLKRVLREVGNGGFGPGSGLLGVRGGATDEHGSSLVDLYDSFSAKNPEDPGWCWPSFLVPICAWGDSTYSCVDCATIDGQLVTFDANGYRPGTDLDRLLEPQQLSLEAWLRAWVEGTDLWSQMFPLDENADTQGDASFDPYFDRFSE